MREQFLPFCRPCVTDDDINAVVEVLKSGWITTGPKCTELEELFKSQLDVAGAVACTSGTGAMHCVLKALNIGPGDEVITPSMTWLSTINVIEDLGATPVFVDVDRETLLLDASVVEDHITDRTRVVIPVHFAGAPVDMDPIRALASKRDIHVVEDAAHALGTSYQGKPIGSSGTAVFSFQAIKNVTAAEGGMVTSDDEELAGRIRRLRFFGLAVDAFDRSRLGAAARAEVQEPGLKYNMADMNAALVLSQMTRLSEINARRDAIVMRYRELFADVAEIRPLADPTWDHVHARHLFVVRIEDSASVNRDELMDKLKEFNIGTGVHFIAAHTHRWYREHRPVPAGSLPNTEWNSSRMCSLPLFPDMTDSDVDDVVAAVKSVLAGQAASAGVSS
jgi:UDP-4-amino-4-deoxy-L-arabinose-oxoglutarate aminotransferase